MADTNFLFLTGESDGGIAVALNRAYMSVEKHIRDLNARDYGTSLDSICIVFICATERLLSDGFLKERRYVSYIKKYADIRLQIKWTTFEKASPCEQRLWVIKILFSAIQYLDTRNKLDFNGKKLITDIIQRLELTAEDLEKIDALS